MSLETRLLALTNAIGADVKTLNDNDGDLTSLSTTAKGNLVAAINEVKSIADAAAGGGTSIDDTAGDGDTTVTWSADKSFDEITAAIDSLRTELLGPDVNAALDTFSEIADALNDDASLAATLSTSIANRVRYDAVQTITGPQQTQARSNIGAASASDLTDLTNDIGDADQDLLAAYNTAKA